jgi:hypothetical protein
VTVTTGFIPNQNHLRVRVHNESAVAMGLNLVGSVTGFGLRSNTPVCCQTNLSIAGSKFNDLNGNGLWDSGEPAIPGWPVLLDGSGGPQTAVTDGYGDYYFMNLQPGMYTVSESPGSGYTQTYPPLSQGYHVVYVNDGSGAVNVNFGNHFNSSLEPKFIQWPDISTNGLDVRATATNLLADDFLCTSIGSITNIKIWGSWLGDVPAPNARFLLGMWKDVAATTNQPSHPGNLLWSGAFGPGEYSYGLYTNSHERFYDPNIFGVNGLIGFDTNIWWYSFNPTNQFCQNGTTNQPLVYWLSVSVDQTGDLLFGWKTSTNHWNDAAVYGHITSGTPLKDWQVLRDPRNTNTLDLSFQLLNNPSPRLIVVESSEKVAGPWAEEPGAVIDPITGKITVPLSGPMRFYRLKSKCPTKILSVAVVGSTVVITYEFQ